MFILALSSMALERLQNEFIQGFNKENYSTLAKFATCTNVRDKDFEDYTPIKFLISLRSDLTNEILTWEDNEFYKKYVPLFDCEAPFDDGVFSAGRNFMYQVFSQEVSPEIVMMTELLPLGAIIFEGNPYVYTQIVISHSLISKLSDGKMKFGKFVPIESLKPTKSPDKYLPLILTKEVTPNG